MKAKNNSSPNPNFWIPEHQWENQALTYGIRLIQFPRSHKSAAGRKLLQSTCPLQRRAIVLAMTSYVNMSASNVANQNPVINTGTTILRIIRLFWLQTYYGNEGYVSL